MKGRQCQYPTQPKEDIVVWIYGLFTDKDRDYIKKKKKDAVFQRGNPIPYLIAISKIEKEKPYVELDKNILISKNEDSLYLFKHFENDMKIKFKEQMGRGYIFSDENKDYLLTSEVYLKKYIVWNIHEINIDKFKVF